MTLMNLTDEWLYLFRRMNEDGDESGEINESVADAWARIEADIATKVDGCADFIRELGFRAAACKEEAEMYRRKAAAWEARQKWIKDMVLVAMQKIGADELNTAKHRLKIAGNGGSQGIEFTGDVSDAYQKSRVVTEPDVDAIRATLLSGVELPFAKLKERGKHLRVS